MSVLRKNISVSPRGHDQRLRTANFEKWLASVSRANGVLTEKLLAANVDKSGITPAESSLLWEKKQSGLAGSWTRLRSKVATNIIVDQLATLVSTKPVVRIVIYSFAAASGYHEYLLSRQLNSQFPGTEICWVLSDSNGVAVMKAIERFVQEDSKIRVRRVPLIVSKLNEPMIKEMRRQEERARSYAMERMLTSRLLGRVPQNGKPGFLRFDVGNGRYFDIAPFQAYAYTGEEESFARHHKVFQILGLLEFFPELIIPILGVARIGATCDYPSMIVTSQTGTAELTTKFSGSKFLSAITSWFAQQQWLLRILGGNDPFVNRRDMESKLFNSTYGRYCDNLSVTPFGGHALAVSAHVKFFNMGSS
ncbi:MAG: hypothetical protein HY562_01840 [Ignavibacteriales bacterium]|nr:hypothetical protein [Ignavibacteriales bacterium]